VALGADAGVAVDETEPPHPDEVSAIGTVYLALAPTKSERRRTRSVELGSSP
jgi:hypothetical protein